MWFTFLRDIKKQVIVEPQKSLWNLSKVTSYMAIVCDPIFFFYPIGSGISQLADYAIFCNPFVPQKQLANEPPNSVCQCKMDEYN